MEQILILMICVITILVLGLIIRVTGKQIKQIGEDKELNELTKPFPSNKEICKTILKQLHNDTVTIEEANDKETTLYIALTNKIVIANIKNIYAYTRVQTIAHECLHSIQDRALLLFNFFFSNFYFIYFAVALILTMLGMVKNTMLQTAILLILGAIYYFVRSFLETDAMTKAKYVAKEYLEDNQITNGENIEKLVNKYDRLNNAGIKYINYRLFCNCIMKVALYSLVCVILFFLHG